MTYCTKQNLIDRFGEAELIQRTDRNGVGVIDDQVLNQAINDAGSEMDGYLTQYALPLAVIPGALTRIACDMSRYYLYHDLDSDVVKARYQSAVAFLKQVAKGTVKLGIDSNGAAPIEQTVVISASPPKLFGRV